MATIFRPPLIGRYARPDSRVAVSSQDWVRGTDFLLGTGAKPFAQYDWPVPPGPRQGGIDRRTWIWPAQTLNLAVSIFPFSQTDWPVPIPRDRAFANRTWLGENLLPLTVVAAPVPFHQTEWPVPRGWEWNRDLRTFISPVAINLVTTALPPFRSPFDMRVPLGPRSNVRLEQIPPNLLTTTLKPPPATGGYDFHHYYPSY